MGAEAADVTVDIDHQTPEFIAERHSRYHELRERCPVVFNEHYGGFWMVTDYESVAQVARDNETFAHKYEPDAPDGISYHGICGVPRPGYIPRQGVSEIDGPEHADLRRVLNPLMTINAVESNRPRMEAVSAWFIDEIIESGEADSGARLHHPGSRGAHARDDGHGVVQLAALRRLLPRHLVL